MVSLRWISINGLQNMNPYITTMQLSFEQVCDLFDQSECTNIFPYKQKGNLCLSSLAPFQLSPIQVLGAIRSILNALAWLRMNMVFPSQLNPSYVICIRGTWGLRHAICRRSPAHSNSQQSYKINQYAFHSDSQNELIWNLGKIWIRFYADVSIDITTMSQTLIDEIIEKNVRHLKSKALMKRLLCKDAHNRIPFQSLIIDGLMIDEGETVQPNRYSQILHQISKTSSIIHNSKAFLKNDHGNPFLKARKMQRFYEYLDMETYLNKWAIEIKTYFFDARSVEASQAAEFISYIITLQKYQQMQEIYTELLSNNLFKKTEQRKYYSEFVKKIVQTKERLMKTKKEFKGHHLGSDFDRFFVNPDQVEEQTVYIQYKSTLNQCLEIMEDQLKTTANLVLMWSLLIKTMIIRTIKYIFVEARTEIFQDFLPQNGEFQLKTVLQNIQKSKQFDKIKALYKKISRIHFKKKSQKKSQIPSQKSS